MLPILAILAIALSTQAVGQIRGVVTDPLGASIPGALIRVLESQSRAAVASGTSDPDGSFQITIPIPGSYTLTAWKQGFRTGVINGVVVQGGKITDLSKIHLDVAGCDAPGILCFMLTGDLSEGVISHGLLKVNLNCGVDLSEGKLYCPVPSQQRTADFEINKYDGAGIYLIPLNGAAVSATCSESTRSTDRVRMDGFGEGYDLCILTRDGHMSRVFLTS